MKTVLQFHDHVSSSVQGLGRVQVCLGGANRIYRGPHPTAPGDRVPPALAECLVLGVLPGVQRDGHGEKGRVETAWTGGKLEI